jgi:uncharacterized protein (DUF488 family)
MKIYTIGFTKKSAKSFFYTLKENRISKVIDIRLNNTSQLAGFSKGLDLAYFLNEIVGAGYEHLTSLAPTKVILDSYKKGKIDWKQYEEQYLELINNRNLSYLSEPEIFNNACFLCSEELPNNCHRRLIAKYLKEKNPDKEIEIIHL